MNDLYFFHLIIDIFLLRMLVSSFSRDFGSLSKLIPSTTLFERRLRILEMGAVVPVQHEQEPRIQRAR